MTISRELNPQERLDWLRLIRSENVGPVTFHQLMQRYGSAAAALAALPDLAKRGGRRDFKVCPRGDAERELTALAKAGARLVAWGEPDYPPLLAVLDDAPPLLSLRGHPHLANKSCVGMVGARNASAAGQRFARDLARELGQAGIVVASGLARGIDGAAHKGALEIGTIAVVAGGVDVVYPEENRALYNEIVERGLIIAEVAVGIVPQARHFPRRNRLISGLSRGVVVVEAALRSGSLITARFAAEQGREVFAVPGSPLDPRCRGTNDLIRHGAVLTESAADVIAELRSLDDKMIAETRRPRYGVPPAGSVHAGSLDEQSLAAARAQVLELLGPTPVAVDEVIRLTEFAAPVVLTVLLELELAGRVERHPGNQVSVQL